jgi:hypothetical protein
MGGLCFRSWEWGRGGEKRGEKEADASHLVCTAPFRPSRMPSSSASPASPVRRGRPDPSSSLVHVLDIHQTTTTAIVRVLGPVRDLRATALAAAASTAAAAGPPPGASAGLRRR